MILAFEKFEKLPLDTLKQLYYLSKQLKYDLYDIFFEMVRQYDAKPLDKSYEKFEQIIYRKQVDFKKPTTNYNGSLKSLYSKAVSTWLNISTATIIFSGNYIRSAHA